MKIPFFPVNLLKYCQYPSFWLLTLSGPIGHNIDLTSEFLLGTEIAHVWEENESLVIRYCGIWVPIRASWKISVKTGHPVGPLSVLLDTLLKILYIFLNNLQLQWSILWKFSQILFYCSKFKGTIDFGRKILLILYSVSFMSC